MHSSLSKLSAKKPGGKNLEGFQSLEQQNGSGIVSKVVITRQPTCVEERAPAETDDALGSASGF
jgi:hypothetical protein